MAKQFLTDLNLNKNELQNVVLQNLAYPPSNSKMGQLYYDSQAKMILQYNGEKWMAVGSAFELEWGEDLLSRVPLILKSTDGTQPTSEITFVGEYGTVIFVDDNGRLMITSERTSLSGEEAETGYVVKLKKMSVDKETHGNITSYTEAEIPLADAEKMGLLSPELFSKLNGLTIDSAMSDSSTNPVQNKIIKNYIDTAIGNLPKEQFLDLTKTTYVDSFTWSSTTYPGSTNPNLNGKPVMVLALKDNDGNVQYGFVSLNDLVDVYTGETPISVSGGKITHANSGATAGSYGDSGAQTPGFGDKFKVLYATVDAKGHITGLSAHDVTIPSATATTSEDGLLSKSDKSKLNNVTTNTYIKTGSIAAGSKSATITLNATADKVISVNAYVSGEHVECDWSVSGSTITVSIAQTLSSAVTIEAFAMKTL